MVETSKDKNFHLIIAGNNTHKFKIKISPRTFLALLVRLWYHSCSAEKFLLKISETFENTECRTRRRWSQCGLEYLSLWFWSFGPWWIRYLSVERCQMWFCLFLYLLLCSVLISGEDSEAISSDLASTTLFSVILWFCEPVHCILFFRVPQVEKGNIEVKKTWYFIVDEFRWQK